MGQSTQFIEFARKSMKKKKIKPQHLIGIGVHFWFITLIT